MSFTDWCNLKLSLVNREWCVSKLSLAKSLYKRIMKREWDFKNPKTFTEKIWWLKIYDSTPLKSFCADKLHLHDYSIQVLGKDICIPVIKVYNKVEDINYNELPNAFVIKCNHGSGYNIIVKDKSNVNKAEIAKKIKKWMSEDYSFVYDCELHYHLIDRKIYIEEYKESLNDIKIFCFNGRPMFCQVDKHFSEHRMNFYDCNWNYIPWISNSTYPANPHIQDAKPTQLNEMLELATLLSKDFKFVRVDLYPREDGIYLGELTFTPGGGRQHYMGDGDKKIGEMLDL